MRENEMRQRVERFLQTRLRAMLLPATLGLGLAVGACDSEGLATDDGGQQAKEDSGSVATKYMAPAPDAGLPLPTPEYMAQSPDVRINLDTMVLRYQAQMPPDAGVFIYAAIFPPTRS
jgi:hypothetical protein